MMMMMTVVVECDCCDVAFQIQRLSSFIMNFGLEMDIMPVLVGNGFYANLMSSIDSTGERPLPTGKPCPCS